MSERNSPSKKIQATVRITRSDQTPLQTQEVILAQKEHKFLFGTAAFDLLPLTNGEYSGANLEKAEERAHKMLAICNAATLPFYWGTFEPEQGKPITEKMKNAAAWAKSHGMTVKGHPLCWHTLTADWLLKMNNTEILDAQLKRIQRDVADFKGMIDMWDVINEAVIMPIFDKYDNGITRLCKEKGRIETIKAMFETTRAVNPSATLLINDFETSVAYDILIEGCLAAGIKFDVIGIQSHMHQGYWGVEKTMEILDRFSRFNLPIHFTETTIISGQIMPPEIMDLNDYQVSDWPSTPEGEERQALEVVTHYKTLFNHPLVEGITWWDLSDGHWLNAPAGLLRKDGTSKPAYEELLKLIKGDWWVAPTRLATDENGCIHFSGYPGKYEITCGNTSRTFDLTQPDQVLEVS